MTDGRAVLDLNQKEQAVEYYGSIAGRFSILISSAAAVYKYLGE